MVWKTSPLSSRSQRNHFQLPQRTADWFLPQLCDEGVSEAATDPVQPAAAEVFTSTQLINT